MSERKVLTKYYPPDFDPAAIGRVRKPKGAAAAGPKVQTVRLMAPFSLRCVACGEYMYRGRKFNARKETPQGERYLGIQLFRFYIRCTRCSAEIVFRTDPKNQDYVMEKGAKRNTDPWKRGLEGGTEGETDEERLDRLEREMAEEAGDGSGWGEEKNAMADLEAKTADAKREMAVADALDEIRVRNARLERANREDGGAGLEGVVEGVVRPEEEVRRREEEEDAEAARKAFAFVRQQEMLEEVIEEDGEGEDGVVLNGGGSGSSSGAASTPVVESKPASVAPSTDMPPPPLPTFKRQVKKKKDYGALLGIKKKQPLV